MKYSQKLAAALLMLLPAASLNAATRYVSPGGTGDGSSWAQATNDLQAAIDASENGDEIWVAAGSYKPTALIKSNKPTSKAFILKDGVSLYGGFAGTEAALDERATDGAAYDMTNETILDADDDVPDVWTRVIAEATTYRWEWELTNNQVNGTKGNSSHVLYSATTLASPTVIDGFTLKGANANVATAKPSGGAVYAPGKIDLRNCRIIENSAYFTAEADNCNSYGAAVYLNGGSIKDCYIAKTFCHSSYGSGIGGGVFAQNSTIAGCVFEDCVGLDGGGAVYMQGGTLERCTFARCYSSSGGAIYNNGGTVSNIEILDCRALKGGGIFNAGNVTDALIRGCHADATEYSEGQMYGGAVYNQSGDLAGIAAFNNSAYDGGGIYLTGGRLINATVQNNTVRNTEGGANVAGTTDGTVLNSISGTDVKASNFISPTAFAGRATDDAQMAALTTADWRLAPGSEFIDAGTPVDGYTQGTDLAGKPRVSGASIDCGAYEAQGNEKIPTIVLTFAPGTQAAKLGVGGDDGYEFTIDWGDGVEQAYNTQSYHEGLLKGSTVKIYGDEIVLLYANSQDIVAADLSRASSLTRTQLQTNGLTSLVLGEHPSLDGIYAAGNSLTSIDVSKCPAIKVLDLHENAIEGAIDCSAMSNLSKIDVADNRLSSLTLPKTTTLYEIDCSRNQLTELDVTGLDGLDELSCSENKLTELDLTGLTAMTSIYADGNMLTRLDISPCTSLEKLMAAENAISSISLAGNKTLSGVYLQNNRLTELDVTKNPNVRWLNVGNNSIDELDVKAQPYLSILIANNNRISEIDLTANTSLSSLDLSGNRLNAIDVSKASYLSQFHIENNAISSLDLSGNAYLYGLFCGNNLLTSLDIAKNTYLQRLEAQGNALTELDITNNKGLQEILLQSNNLDAGKLAAFISALPDVSTVPSTPETEDFIRKLNISFMPGTAEADIAAAEAKGWFVTAEFDKAEEITLTSLDILINRCGSDFAESWNATIEWSNDDHSAISIKDFIGSGSSLNAQVDAEGNVKIAPQVCGMDEDYNYLMIVNAESTTANPMKITDTYVAGHFDGTSLRLEEWNLIIVPYSFAENLGTFYTGNISSEFVKSNGTMEYTTADGKATTQNIYAMADTDNADAVVVYGWGERAMAVLSRVEGKWTADGDLAACTTPESDYTLSSENGEPLVATAQPDARTLIFGAWQLKETDGTKMLLKGSNATLHFGFNLPSQNSGITDALTDAEIVSTVYYNAAGITSTTPFSGFNIKVDTLSDGTRRITKLGIRR